MFSVSDIKFKSNILKESKDRSRMEPTYKYKQNGKWVEVKNTYTYEQVGHFIMKALEFHVDVIIEFSGKSYLLV